MRNKILIMFLVIVALSVLFLSACEQEIETTDTETLTDLEGAEAGDLDDEVAGDDLTETDLEGAEAGDLDTGL